VRRQKGKQGGCKKGKEAIIEHPFLLFPLLAHGHIQWYCARGIGTVTVH